MTVDARKFHHDNLESALNFYAKNDYFDMQVKFLKDGVIHYAPTDGDEPDDLGSWMRPGKTEARSRICGLKPGDEMTVCVSLRADCRLPVA